MLTARADAFTVHINGMLALSGKDSDIERKGRFGFYSWGNTAARFESLKIRPL